MGCMGLWEGGGLTIWWWWWLLGMLVSWKKALRAVWGGTGCASGETKSPKGGGEPKKGAKGAPHPLSDPLNVHRTPLPR